MKYSAKNKFRFGGIYFFQNIPQRYRNSVSYFLLHLQYFMGRKAHFIFRKENLISPPGTAYVVPYIDS